MSLAYHVDPDRAVVRLEGPDAATFFQGYSTQETRSLVPGEATRAAVTTRKGTMLDWVLVLRDETGLTLVGGPGRGAILATTLDRYTLGVDVTVTDRSAGTRVVTLIGSWSDLVPVTPDEAPRFTADARRWSWRGTVEGEALCASHPALPEIAIWVVDEASWPTREAYLRERGAEPWEADRIEGWRVGAGFPASGHEIGEDVNPWEARLETSISLEKGCYLGQEVVARLFHYRKIQRQLMGLSWPAGTRIAIGTALLDAERPVGVVTSVSGERGLGLVKVAHAHPGKRLGTATGEETVTLEDRPFWLP
jgi:folate-binding protein YgfZ